MNQISFDDLFAEETKVEETPSLSPLQGEIYSLVESGETSAIQICETLVKAGKLPSGRFSTNKPKAYPHVCSVLEALVQKDKILFIEDKDKHDRIYQIKVSNR
jgi:hypothetical protein